MPENYVAEPPRFELEHVVRLTRFFARHGVDKVRLTGGEPLLYPRLTELIGDLGVLRLKTLGMTTNGLTLHRKVERLGELGLNSINISLDTLIPAKFEFITRRPSNSLANVR
jgi:cyclic pyranopterin phosphate synthase